MPDSDYIVSNGEVLSSRSGDRMWKVPAGVTCHLPDQSIIEIKAGLIVVEGNINGYRRGYIANNGPGTGTNTGGGAGHGGAGGNSGLGSGGGPTYGNPTDDTVYLGSGGRSGTHTSGGKGGGAIILEAPFVIISG
ncbi:MAG: hypothetical protein QXT45_08190, partial [Candidatus Bilamarchaeaceae archaeon]